MEFIIFATIVLTYHIWLPFFLQVILFFIPDSWRHEPSSEDSRAPIQPSIRRKAYHDPTPDPFEGLQPTTGWVANQFMSAETKQFYLKSLDWRIIRQQVLLRDNYECKSCGATEFLEVHHLSYFFLGKEPLCHLITLCRICHQHQHDVYGYSRDKNYSPVVSIPNTSKLNNSVLPEDSK